MLVAQTVDRLTAEVAGLRRSSYGVLDRPFERAPMLWESMTRAIDILTRELRRPVMRFAIIGLVSTAAYAMLYLILRQRLGPDSANALALALTAVANTQANRRFTFGVRGRNGLLRQHAAGAAVYVIALAITAGALDFLGAMDRHPPRTLELAVLLLASVLATVTRYAALRTWVFARTKGDRQRPRAGASSQQPSTPHDWPPAATSTGA